MNVNKFDEEEHCTLYLNFYKDIYGLVRIGILSVQLTLDLTYDHEQSKFNYPPQSCSCDILGPYNIAHIILCKIS